MDRTDATICGHNCIEIYLRALKESGLETETKLLKYGQSNQVTSMRDMSVSYCALRTTLRSCDVFLSTNNRMNKKE